LITTRPPPHPPLFPYTTLFRSDQRDRRHGDGHHAEDDADHRFAADDHASLHPWSISLVLAPSHYEPPLYTIAAKPARFRKTPDRSEEHTSELQSQSNLVCRLLL